MNITFLIGNGFDVGIGMKSKFKNFFPVYQNSSKEKSERIRKLSQEIGEDYETWADFEVALGKYTLKFDGENKQDFIDQIKDFEFDFIQYLEKEESALNFNDNIIEKRMKDALLKYYAIPNLAPDSNEIIRGIYSKYSSSDYIYNFVNFNYTSSLEKCLKNIPQDVVFKRKFGNQERIDKIGRVVHVHGSCGLYPIIGVNDSSQIANKELAEDDWFTRYVVKPSLNKLLRQGNDVNATNLINQSTIICVYGMALGETDKKWWDLLVRWLSASGDRQLIIFDYDEKYTTYNQFAWLEKEDSIINKLKLYNSDSRIRVESLRPRIHIAVHKNIFAMNILKKDNE